MFLHAAQLRFVKHPLTGAPLELLVAAAARTCNPSWTGWTHDGELIWLTLST